MTWKRGFFRLWVLVSVLWVVLVGASTAGVIIAFVRGEIPWVYTPSPMTVNADGSFDLDVPGQPIMQGRGEAPDIFYFKVPPVFELSIPIIGAVPVYVSAFRPFAAVMFLPPLVLLVAGYAVAWVIRGFLASRV